MRNSNERCNFRCMTKLLDYAVLAIAGSAILGFVYWAWKDIHLEKRPVVTDEMIEEAFERDVLSKSDAEMEDMDWLSDDDD